MEMGQLQIGRTWPGLFPVIRCSVSVPTVCLRFLWSLKGCGLLLLQLICLHFGVLCVLGCFSAYDCVQTAEEWSVPSTWPLSSDLSNQKVCSQSCHSLTILYKLERLFCGEDPDQQFLVYIVNIIFSVLLFDVNVSICMALCTTASLLDN